MIVIDASIAVKWIMKDEEDSDKAQAIYQKHILKTVPILVPQLFFIEVTNSLITKSSSRLPTIEKSLRFLYGLQLSVYNSDQADMTATAQEARKYKTTVYDMLYTVVARKHNLTLVTADEKFVRKTQFPFVKLLSEYKPK